MKSPINEKSVPRSTLLSELEPTSISSGISGIERNVPQSENAHGRVFNFSKAARTSSIEDLIAQLDCQLSIGKTFASNRSRKQRKQKPHVRECKTLRKSLDKKTLRLMKLVEPTSGIEALIPKEYDTHSVAIEESIEIVPPTPEEIYHEMLDEIERWLIVCCPRTRELDAYMSLMDLDGYLDPVSGLRIPLHILEFVSGAYEHVVDFMLDHRDSMPLWRIRRLIRRSVELQALAAAKAFVKRKFLKVGVVRRFKKKYERFLFIYSMNYLFHNIYPQQVEATSRISQLLHGIGASIYSAKQFYDAGTSDTANDQIKRSLMNWSMSLVSVIKANRITDWVLWALQFVNIFTPLESAVAQFWELIRELFQRLPTLGFGPQQQVIGQVVEPTSNIEEMISKACEGLASNVGMVAAVLSAISVFAGSVLVGSSMPDVSKASNIAEKLIKSGSHIAKTKTGVYAIIQMISDFKPWIETSVSHLLKENVQDSFSKSIADCDVDDTEDFKKTELFEYINDLIHPENYQKIRQSKLEQRRLNWCHSVIFRVLEKNVTDSVLSTAAVQHLTKLYTELGKVRVGVYRYASQSTTRFVPMWINIVGAAGTRKSTYMMKFANNMIAALRKLGKYDVPGDDCIFSVNFTDRFMTDYRQEFCVLVDDIFQDAAPLGERSSALDIISWVSNIPHHTNQAAMEDKGIPFTSKLLISTSNVEPAALQRKEIVCPEALKRRMSCYQFVVDPKAPYDDMLEARIRIYKIDPLAEHGHKTLVKSAREMCAMALKEFSEHYFRQMRLIENSGADPECVDYMINSLNEEVKGVDTVDSLPNIQKVLNKMKASIPEKKEMPRHHPGIREWLSKQPSASNAMPIWEEDLSDSEVEPTSDIERKDPVEATSLLCDMHHMLFGRYMWIDTEAGNRARVYDTNKYPHWHCRNAYYANYVDVCVETGEAVRDIDEFYKESSKLTQLTESMGNQIKSFGSYLATGLAFVKSKPTWMFLTAALALAVSYKIFFSKNKSSDIVDELIPTAMQYDYGKPVQARPAKARIVTPTSGAGDAYMQDFTVTGTDTNAMDLVLNTLIGKGQIVRLITILPEDKCSTAVAVRIGGTTILANHHYFTSLKKGQKFTVEVPHYIRGVTKVQQCFDPRRLARIGTLDACLYRCDNAIQNAKVITHHFSKDESSIKSINAIIASRNPEAMYVSNVTAVPNTVPLTYKDSTETVRYSVLGDYEVLNYACPKGTSGSLLVALDPYTPRKLLGIQTSRNTDRKSAYFAPLTERMLLDACKEIGETLNATPVERDLVVEQTSVIFDDNCPPNLGHQSLQYIGTMPKSHTIAFQTKSKIQPSLIQDVPSLTKAPAALDKWDVRLHQDVRGKNLMFKNVEGYDQAQYGALKLDLLDIVEEALANEYSVVRSIPGIQRRLLNDDEMVNGIRGKINPLDMSTSPGYPWVKQRIDTNTPGKYEWFSEWIEEDGRKMYTMRDDLEAAVRSRELAAQSGQRVPTIGYTCLKDETRPLLRVENGVTRIFICLPMDYNLLIRKYFGMFIATQHAKAGEQPSSVGLDPTTDWKKLFNRLRTKGDDWEDFDYKNWDQTLHPEFLFRYARIVNKWYGDADDSPAGKVRITLVLELAHTFLMIGDKLFLKSGGQDSGCAITAEINCDVHDILMLYVFLYLLVEEKEKKGNTPELKQQFDRAWQDILTYYRDNVAIAVYGDDIVKSCTPEVQRWFNGNTIAPIMQEIGMKITPADKDSTEFRVKPPEEVTFLKRSFKPDPQYPQRTIRCPLDLKTIWNIPQWIKKGNDEIEATRVNCEMALREMYMYGKNEFNTARDELNRRIREHNIANVGREIPPMTLSYDVLEKSYEEGNLEICFPKGWRELREEDFEDLGFD